MKIKIHYLFLALITASCAGQTELKVIDPAFPLKAEQSTTPLAVGDITFVEGLRTATIGHFHGGAANIPYSSHSGKILEGMPRRIRIIAFDELSAAGYKIASRKEDLISQSKILISPDAKFTLGGHITKVIYDTFSSVFKQSSESSATVTWTLKNEVSGRQVGSIATSGKVEGPHEDIGTILVAVRASLRKALADHSFVSVIK